MTEFLLDDVTPDATHFTRYREPDATLPLGFADDVPIDHDALDPHPEIPTPLDLVVRLTRPERERRVERLVEMARESYREALTVLGNGKTIVATCSLVSGGSRSCVTCSTSRNSSVRPRDETWTCCDECGGRDRVQYVGDTMLLLCGRCRQRQTKESR